MTKKLVVLFCLMAVSAGNGQTSSGPAASAATRYTVFLAGNKAGFESSSRNLDGSLQITGGQKSIAELLAMPEAARIEFEPPRLKGHWHEPLDLS